MVFSASGDMTIKLWDLATAKEMKVLRGHHDNIWSVGFSPDSKYVVSGSADKNVKMWEAANGNL